jgi:hypothetical protein
MRKRKPLDKPKRVRQDAGILGVSIAQAAFIAALLMGEGVSRQPLAHPV